MTLGEFIQLEDDATAVLGASDDKNCTYDNGYVYRQALYACLTCVPKGSPEAAGVCLACSLKCHDGHELIELYTKRNFRCDCGNQKFGGFTCQLRPDKDLINEKNKYNHNFVGEYCSCNRPYPDPEYDGQEDSMIQCVVCEDWLHGSHLQAGVPADDEYSEMICHLCIDRSPFLRFYGFQAGEKLNRSDDQQDGDQNALEISGISGDPDASSNDMGNDQQQIHCKYFTMAAPVSRKGAVFFRNGWRDGLCRCEQCVEMYQCHNCAFLMDNTDTVQHYEEVGRAMHDDGVDDTMKFLGQQDRVVQIELAHGYNEFKQGLAEFLKTMAEKRKVVEKEDVDEFFTALRTKRQRRMDMLQGGGCDDDVGGSGSAY